jgi:hypothetical protein
MRVARVALVLVPLFGVGGCEDRGTSQADSFDTERPASGGFTPDSDSSDYHAGDVGSPSGRQPRWRTREGRAAHFGSSPQARGAALSADETVPPLPPLPGPPPPDQDQTFTPSGKAGGTLNH